MMTFYTIDGLTKVRMFTNGLSLESLSRGVDNFNNIQHTLDYLNRVPFPGVTCPYGTETAFFCDTSTNLKSTTEVLCTFFPATSVPGPPIEVTDFLGTTNEEDIITFTWTQSPNASTEHLYRLQNGMWSKLEINVSSPYIYFIEPDIPFSYRVESENPYGVTFSNISLANSQAPLEPIVRLVPTLNGPRNGPGIVSASSSYNSGTGAWRLFSYGGRLSTTRWASARYGGALANVDYNFMSDAVNVIKTYEIRIATVGVAPIDWEVLTSLDGETWTLVSKVIDEQWELSGDYSVKSYAVDLINTCRYVRIETQRGNSTDHVEIAEFNLYGHRRTDDTPVLPVIPPVTSSGGAGIVTTSSNSSYGYRSIDNSSDTSWSSQDNAIDEWWEYQFDAPVKVLGLTVETSDSSITNMMANWSLQGSIDGLVYADLITESDNTVYPVMWNRYFDLPSLPKYSYYRIHVTSNIVNDTTTPFYIGDIQLYSEMDTELGGQVIPPMTSNTSPSGIAAASSYYVEDAYHAMDGSNGTQWVSADDATDEWIEYTFDTLQSIESYGIRAPYGNTQYANMITEWNVLVSFTEGVWTQYASVNLSQPLFPGERRVFSLGDIPINGLRIQALSNDGDGLSSFALGGLELFLSTRVAPYIVNPKMTSNTSPFGTVKSGTQYNSNFYPYRALDRLTSTKWIASNNSYRGDYWRYLFNTYTTLTSVQFLTSDDTDLPDNFRFDYTYDGRTWYYGEFFPDVDKIGFNTKSAIYEMNPPLVDIQSFRISMFNNELPTPTPRFGFAEIYLQGENSAVKIPAPAYYEKLSLVPKMTSDTAPSGIASASSITSTGYAPYKGFNGSNGDEWAAADNATNQWLEYDFEVSTAVSSYAITARDGYADQSIAEFRFEGWDGSTWVVLDSRRESVWSHSELREFTITSPGSYNKYRVYSVTGNSDTDSAPLSINNLAMYPAAPEYTLIQDMNSNTTPTGLATSSTEASGSYTPFKAFDKDHRSEWATEKTNATGWLQYEFDTITPYIITRYVLELRDAYFNQRPVSWVLEGTDDNLTYTVMDTVTNHSWTSLGETATFTVAAPGSYKAVRIRVTQNGGDPDYLSISQFQLIGE